MTHTWSSDSVAAKLDQGVFLVLMAIGMFLMALDKLAKRPMR